MSYAVEKKWAEKEEEEGEKSELVWAVARCFIFAHRAPQLHRHDSIETVMETGIPSFGKYANNFTRLKTTQYAPSSTEFPLGISLDMLTALLVYTTPAQYVQCTL